MQLHGHQTIPMHLRYLHLDGEDATEAVGQIFARKRYKEVQVALGAPLLSRMGFTRNFHMLLLFLWSSM